MKKTLYLIALGLVSSSINAQISDSVSIGAGYANESYYSLQDGEVINVVNNDWDLAFDVSNFGATIRANRLSAIYLYPGSLSDWETLDTAGIVDWTRYYNNDLSWSNGALNAPANLDEPTDLGWGLYNSTTHFTEGNRLFVVQLQSGDYKKLFVEELGMGIYTFQTDFLDNSALENVTIVKADHNSMNFVHYSLETNTVIEREPAKDSWDIVFSNYHSEVAPGAFYGVSGALINPNVEALQIDGIATEEATFTTPFETQTNILGHDWKSFNFDTYAYDITDSLTYFIYTSSEEVWKFIFTGFGGSATGKFYFTKQLVSTANIAEETTTTFNCFPNPTTDNITLTSTAEINTVKIYSLSGQCVLHIENVNNTLVTIDLTSLTDGTYITETITSNGLTSIQKVQVIH